MILIGTDDGIYRWFEGCGWPIFHSLQGRAIAALDSPGAGLLAAIDREGLVFESVNNGQDWRTVPGPGASGSASGQGTPVPTALAVWGEPSTIVLATRPLGLSQRVIGSPLPRGATSSSKSRGLAPAWIGRARTLAGGATARLAPGRPRGTSGPSAIWSAIGTPPVPKGRVAASASVRALAAGAGSPAPWFAAIRGAGLWRSPDEGTSWQQCPGLPDEVNTVRTFPSRPGALVAATSDGCRFSVDDGRTWEDRSAGLENARHVGALEVKPGEPGRLLAGAAPRPPGAPGAAPADGLRSALYESSDGGKSWSRARGGFPEDFAHDVITDIRYDPAAPDNAVVALGSGELWITRNDGFYWAPLARQIRAARVLCAVG